jgi:hypothetical protein
MRQAGIPNQEFQSGLSQQLDLQELHELQKLETTLGRYPLIYEDSLFGVTRSAAFAHANVAADRRKLTIDMNMSMEAQSTTDKTVQVRIQLTTRDDNVQLPETGPILVSTCNHLSSRPLSWYQLLMSCSPPSIRPLHARQQPSRIPKGHTL